MIDDKTLDKLLEFSTREEQKAFLEGVKFLSCQQPKQEIVQATVQPAVQLSFQQPQPLILRRQPNRGLAADMLRMLWTGPISSREFLDSLMPNYERHAILKCIRKMTYEGMIAESKETAELFCLTVKGRSAAQYFITNTKSKAVRRQVSA